MKIAALAGFVLLSTCSFTGREPDTKPVEGHSDRFKIERVAVFEDAPAYNGKRSIFIITDTKTGAEYVGVSGVGISELGSHRCGKSQCTDER